ncbi:hypothetical protein [Zobellella aerophila]|uniref:Uncharacterized protein n=1 Tax=Zobellella aerophila TaxID=870480 RepID=A0ABP6V7K7_9GAMM
MSAIHGFFSKVFWNKGDTGVADPGGNGAILRNKIGLMLATIMGYKPLPGGQPAAVYDYTKDHHNRLKAFQVTL